MRMREKVARMNSLGQLRQQQPHNEQQRNYFPTSHVTICVHQVFSGRILVFSCVCPAPCISRHSACCRGTLQQEWLMLSCCWHHAAFLVPIPINLGGCISERTWPFSIPSKKTFFSACGLKR